MHHRKVLKTRCIKLINALMAQGFFGKLKLNGCFEKLFQKFTFSHDLTVKKVADITGR